MTERMRRKVPRNCDLKPSDNTTDFKAGGIPKVMRILLMRDLFMVIV